MMTALAVAAVVSASLLATPAVANPLEDMWNGIVSFFSGDADVEAAAAGDESTTADGSTLKGYEAHLTEGSISTQNIGRIWTDKTVQDKDVDLTPANVKVEKGNSDFLVGLSALSSMSTITNEIPKPLDIVLMLDTSSSMLDQIGGEPNYQPVDASDVTTDNGHYWVQVNNQYIELSNYEVNGKWYWHNSDNNREFYRPRGSNKFDYGTETQFYTISNSKLAALKEAVNGFIASTDEANKEMPTDQKHRIALVRFSDDKKSQEISGFTDNATDLTNDVNNLPANGSTRADIGIDLASGLMNSARNDSQKVVIFFTDGQPNSGGSSFDSTVANASITAASAMNDKGILFYSVGVFEGADPKQTEVDTTDISKFNAYMNGMSSNYPHAQAYDNLGARKGKREYYKVASDRDGLAQVFQDIASELKEDVSESPLSSATGAGSEEGYITFTDELGAYMKVDNFKSVVYANQQFKDPKVTTSDDGLTVTYAFSGTVDGNEIFGQGNMADIIVTVQKADKNNLAQGDIVTVKIPASLIPLRNYTATVKKDGSVEWIGVTAAYPIRVFYGVSLKDGVADSIKNGTADETLKGYVKEHAEKAGKGNNQHDAVTFLSNKFDGTPGQGSGTTTAHFVPAKSNSYYYVDVDTPLYIDRDCKTPLTADNWEQAEEGQFYYQQTFYKQGETKPVTETVEFPTTSLEAIKGQLTPNEKGEYYLPAGAPRLTRIHEFEDAKKADANNTNTAALAVNPNWDEESMDVSSINVQLGNNGKLFVELPGTLKVSKTVTVADGLDKTQLANTEFPFTIHVDGMANTTVKAQLTNSNGGAAIGDPIDLKFDGDSNATHKLKDGQTLIIYGLNDGAAYTVTEGKALNADGTENPGFAQTDPANNASATGTISSAEEKTAAFTNTYSASETTSSPFKAKKTFTDVSDPNNEKPMAWDGATFTFEVSAIGGGSNNGVVTGSHDQFDKPIDEADVPLPQDAQGNKVTSLTVTEDNKDNIDFGTARYTKPGTYVYHITEHTPGKDEGWLPGVSYSNAIYHVEVVVEDNGQGALTVNADKSKMYLETDDAGDDTGDTTRVDVANITNTYQRDADTAQLLATKNWVDTTGSRPNVAKDQFSFTVEAVSGQDANDQAIAKDDIPMPAGKSTVGNSEDKSVAWGNITFTNQMAGNTYTYKLTEEIPAGAEKNPDTGKYEYQGVEYSDEEYTATVTVAVTGDPADPDKQQTTVEVAYTDKDGNPVTGEAERVIFTNTYRVQPVTDDSTLLGQKTLDGRAMKDGEEFTFTLAGADKTTRDALANGDITGLNTEAKAVGTGENTVAEFNFGTPTFKKPGTYTFEVRETGTDGNGLTYDKHASTVTYVVNDTDPNDSTIAHTGNLRVVSVTYDNSGAVEADQKYDDRVAFTNTYRSNASFDGVTVSKTLTGRNMLAKEFNFTITPEGDSPAVSPAADAAFSNPEGRADGQKLQMTGKLSGLKFTQADAGKMYGYIIDEVKPSDDGKDDLPGVGYDAKRYRVSITLNDDGNGTLTPQTIIQEIDASGAAVGQPVSEAAFSNTYTPEETDPVTPELSKVLDGRSWTGADSFTFNVSKVSFNNQASGKDFDAMPMFGTTSKTVTAAAGTASKTPVPFDFGSLTFKKAGTYKYKVTEAIPDEATNEGVKDGDRLIAYKDASDEQKKVAGWKLNGVTYTDKEAVITIRVSDDGADGKKTGKLVATVSYANSPFTNTYNATQYFDDAVDFQLAKTLSGHDMKKGQFKFNVTALDDPAGSTKAVETAQKVGLPTDKLTFAVIGAKGDDGERVPMMDGARQLSFTSADSGKTFVLQFDEAQEQKDGYTYDQTVYQMAITPTDNGDGTMDIKTVVTKVKNAQGDTVNETYIDKSWTSGDAAEEVALDFINKYEAKGSATIQGTKVVEGPWTGDLPGFKFEIKQVANENGDALVDGDGIVRVDLPGGGITTSAANGDFKFESITFTKPGDYYFKVTESDPLGNGWSKKNADPKIVKVSVVEADQDTGNGELIATPDTDDLKALTFTNLYAQTPSDAYTVTIKKTVAGHDATAGQFKFQLIADDAAKAAIKNGAITGVTVDEATGVVATESNKAAITAGKSEEISFAEMTFNKVTTDDGYTFTVKEIADKDDDAFKDGVQNNGWTMDSHEYKVNIKVTDSKPKLIVTATTTDSSTFSNIFGAATTLGANDGLQVTKQLNGRTLVVDQFDFAIQVKAGSDNAGVAAEKLAKLDGVTDGVLSFKNVAPSDNGIAVMNGLDGLAFDQNDIGKTFTYTVSEIRNDAMDNAGYDFDANLEATVTIAVKEGNKGKIYTETTVKKGNDTKIYGKDVANADGKVAVVSFVNSYAATGELDGAANLAGTKTLVDGEGNVVPLNGRTWDFTLSAFDDDTQKAIDGGFVTLPKEVKVQNNADGSFNFGDITFKSTGAASMTYKFKVTETGELKGVVNDPDDERLVEVRVTDNGDGTLTAEVVGNTNLSFVNAYGKDATDQVEVKGTKTLALAEGVDNAPSIKNEFSFTLTADAGAPLNPGDNYNANPTNPNENGTGTVTFGNLKFTMADLAGEEYGTDGMRSKEFTYKVTEAGSVPGIQNDTAAATGKTFKIKLTDDGEGNLTAEVVDATDGNAFAFTNTYAVQETKLEGAQNLEVTKEISGRDWAEDDSFDFELTANMNDPATKAAVDAKNIALPKDSKITVSNDTKDHKAAFGDITFKQAGDFQFYITELGESHDGLTYDTESKLVKVHVADNGDGSLTATVTEGENPTITNAYDVTGSGELTLSGAKTIANRAFDADDSFAFTVTGASDTEGIPAPLPQGDNVTADGDTATVTVKPEAGKTEAAINYGSIAFDKSQLGATFTYTVAEANGGDTIDGLTYDKTVYTVAVKVVDNGNGGVKFEILNVTKTPEVSAARAAEPVTKEQVDTLDFTNTYDSVMPSDESVKTDVTFTKVLDGRDWLDTDAFDFTLTAKTPDAPMPKDKDGNTVSQVTVTKDNAKSFSFGQIAFAYDMVKGEPNKTKTFEYEVAEVKPEQGAIPNVDYTNATATMKITVADNGNGKLVATVTTAGATFTNTYTSSLDYGAMGGLSITKVLDGRDMLDKQFGFTVTAQDGVKTSAADTAKLLGIAKGTSATYDAPAAKNGETALVASLGSQVTFTQDDAGKTYRFTVEETKAGGKGYTNDTAVRTVEIAVADNGDGTLTATTTVSGKGEPQVFTYTTGQTPAATATVPFANSYATTPVYLGGEGNVQLNATKTLTGRDMAADEFGFAVVNTADGSQVATGSNAAAADGAAAPVTFTSIEYTSTGLYADAAAGKATATAGQDGKVVYTYEYAVNEVSGLVDGVTGVATAFSVRVNVTDNNDGTLSIAVAYPEGSGDTLAFANAYGLTATADVTVSGQKRLTTPAGTGYTAPDIAGKYTFTLEGSEGAPMPEKTEAVNDAAGNVSFGDIHYTMENVFGDSGEAADAENAAGAEGADGEAVADADATDATAEAAPAKSAPRQKTFTYTVKESGSVAGVTNDAETVKTFTVTVIDNGDGTITATPSASGFAFSFVNAYAPQPVEVSIDPARKTLSGRDLRDGEFSFDLKDASGAVVKTVQNNAEGVVDLGALTFTAPGTYRYTVSERAPQGGVQNGVTYDGTVYDLVVTVTDAGDGALKASAGYELKGQAVEQMTFANSYRVAPNSISFRAAKILTGRNLKAGEFSFELREGDKVLQTVKNAADGSISFDAIKFTEPGEHDYQIAEVKGDAEGITYDKTVFTYHVSVTDDGDGTLEVTWTEGETGDPVFRNTYQATPPAEVPEEPKPETPKTEEPQNPEQQLPKTGDSMPSPMALGAMAAAGAGLIGCSAVLIKRNRQK